MDLNKVTLIGQLAAEPTACAGERATFSLVTNYEWRDCKKREKKQDTTRHTITVSGKLAEISLTYLKKRSRIYLEGRLQKNGDVVADEIIMLGHKR